MKILGYSDKISVRPGEDISFLVSCDAAQYTADIVQLIHGDTNPDGPGFKVEEVATPVAGVYPGKVQTVYSGSHVVVADHPLLHLDDALTVQVLVNPTRLAAGEQGLVTKWDATSSAGFGLYLAEDGTFTFKVGDGTGEIAVLSSGKPALEGTWYLVAATVDGPELSLIQLPLVGVANGRFSLASSLESITSRVSGHSGIRPKADNGVPLTLAAHVERLTDELIGVVPGALFNGKLDRPRVHRAALSEAEIVSAIEGPAGPALVAAWNFQAEITKNGIERTRQVTDISTNRLHGATVNLPTRAVTGYNWNSKEQNFVHAPEQYGAIHFHDDDLDDARWKVDFTLTVPESLGSALYAARLTADDDVDYIPFYVLPVRGSEKKICFLAPTASYMAYANDQVSLEAPLAQLFVARTPVLQENNIVLSAHRELGLSTYDAHTDGSGVAYSTRLRPILNMRPGFRHWLSPSLWQFNADLHLIDWLTEFDYEFDVITDEDLHREGMAVLSPYNVVLTGSHPEYCSEQMLDGLHSYVESGGRIMYMGGNGFYWVTNFDPESGTAIEVRKGNGSNAWKCKPGEYHLSFTGEYGTLWRHRGRAPQRLFGVGFGSEGFDVSEPFHRTADSFDQTTAWMFEGIGDGPLGAFGLVGDGAAGLELDVYDASLGSPPEAVIVAASRNHTDIYLEVAEELFFNVPGTGGTQNARVRGDIVYTPAPNGGAVWSVSSIAYCGSLSHNKYDNDISLLTQNVLDQFASGQPAPLAAGSSMA
jgi:N,N-dimethylformamidase